MDLFAHLNPIVQALIAGCVTWGFTALGASLVFFFKSINPKLLNMMLGFAAGIMLAASFWSLLLPSVEMSRSAGNIPWIPAVTGFLAGGLFLLILDKVLPHLHLGLPVNKSEGIKTSWHRSTLLVLAITLHNIPEGLAIGVALGAAALNSSTATLFGALTLAIGIGIQDIPEGFAVSVPLRREGLSRLKSFWYGQLSGFVEPVAAVIGAAAVLVFQDMLPYALAFAAGAMTFVVVEELIPESQQNRETDLSTIGIMVGFALMMLLDIFQR